MSMNEITCCDCGTTIKGNGQPKQVAKSNKWEYAGKGKWRCPLCAEFLKEVKQCPKNF